VSPAYLDCVLAFDTRIANPASNTSGFRSEQTLSPTISQTISIPELKRSGRQYQLCYNLKTVTQIQQPSRRVDHDESKTWLISQAAIHHQFDIKEAVATWIVTNSISKDSELIIDALMRKNQRHDDQEYGSPHTCFISSLSTHLLFLNWAEENWRWYLNHLEAKVEADLSLGMRQALTVLDMPDASDNVLQFQGIEDEVKTATTILQSNKNVMESLARFYKSLLEEEEFPGALKTQCRTSILAFGRQVKNTIHQTRIHMGKTRNIEHICHDRRLMVCG